MAEKFNEWWKSPELSWIWPQQQPEQPVAQNGEIYTGAGEDGVVQPNQPAMAIGRAMLHEGETVKKNGQVIPNQDTLRKMEASGKYIGMQTGGNVNAANMRPEGYGKTEKPIPTASGALSTIYNAIPDTVKRDVKSEIAMSQTGQSVPEGYTTPIPAPTTETKQATGIGAVMTPEIAAKREAEKGTTPTDYYRDVMNMESPIYQAQYQKYAQDLSGAATAAQQAAQQEAAQRGLTQEAIGGMQTTMARDALQSASELGAERYLADIDKSFQAAGNYSDELQTKFDNASAMGDIEGMADAYEEATGKRPDTTELEAMQKAKQHERDKVFATDSGQNFADEVTKLQNSGEITSLWDFDSDTFKEGWYDNPTMKGAVDEFFQYNSPYGKNGITFDPTNSAHVEWVEDQMEAKVQSEVDALINNVATQGWFRAKPKEEQDIILQTINHAATISKTEGIKPVINEAGNIVAWADSQNNITDYEQGYTEDDLPEYYQDKKTQEDIENFEPSTDDVWGETAQTIIDNNDPDNQNLIASIYEEQAKDILDPGANHHDLPDNPPDKLVDELIKRSENLNPGTVDTENNERVDEHPQFSRYMSDSYAGEITTTLDNIGVISFGDGLYKYKNPEKKYVAVLDASDPSKSRLKYYVELENVKTGESLYLPTRKASRAIGRENLKILANSNMNFDNEDMERDWFNDGVMAVVGEKVVSPSGNVGEVRREYATPAISGSVVDESFLNDVFKKLNSELGNEK